METVEISKGCFIDCGMINFDGGTSQWKHLEWQQYNIKLFGKEIQQPRLTCFYADKDIFYRYSGLNLNGFGWDDIHLLRLKKEVESITGVKFNSVLCNYYRNGSDYMGMHSDDEKSLGSNPVIASVSFGESRNFVMQKKQGGEKWERALNDCDLLLMRGNIQKEWKHGIRKQLRVNGERINFTFRWIF